MRRSLRAFTLIEVLIVMSIIGLLASILFPVIARSKSAAYRASGLSQIRQIADAQIMYCSDYEDRYATERTWDYSWQDQVRPYLPNVAALHPPQFADSARKEGPNGYVVNYCLTQFSSGLGVDEGSVVMVSEFAILSLRKGDAHGEVSAYVYQFPDNLVAKILTNRGDGDISLLGGSAATKYLGRGAYAFLDSHVSALAPESFYFKDSSDWCKLPGKEDLGASKRAHYALY